jgi:hypothetical protein
MKHDSFKKFTGAIFLLAFSAFIFISCQSEEIQQVEQWGVYELTLIGPSDGNPYLDIALDAKFTNVSNSVTVPGFYDGNGNYKIRFSPNEPGHWTYETKSNLPDLNNLKGSIRCIEPTGNNHGPVRIDDTFYFQYADGSPFYSVGTTAYQWTSVKQSIQEQTLQTLAASPFNKIRMCVFPKSYRFGNDTEPWSYPFARSGEENDFTKPNYAFFQNFDQRVAQLLELGIQADVILFHPYDHWGYCEMGDEMNIKYVRYMIARLSAYRNVWWSLANEWDVPKIKETIDWEGIGNLLQNEDPHQRLRGIHNWYNSEDHFYDHSRPWITHISAQTSDFFHATKWREKYQKPLLFDEMRYEGDVPAGWGNLSSEEMSSYFWMAGLSGGYPTHGETIRNNADTTEVRWWAKGGTLKGESPERIAFFKSVMSDAPINQLHPFLIAKGNPEDLNKNIYTFSSPGNYYLAYTADSGQTIELNLPGTGDYTLEVIDTWNMQIKKQEEVPPGAFSYTTIFPYAALRIQD